MNFRNPSPVVDVIIEIGDNVVLIERLHEPLGQAIPGGFIDYGESAEHAAIREAKEETGLNVTLTELLYVYSDPGRDPRQHTISTVFLATAEGRPAGGDDAKSAFLVPRSSLLSQSLVCDHARILRDYLRFRETGQRPTPREFA